MILIRQILIGEFISDDDVVPISLILQVENLNLEFRTSSLGGIKIQLLSDLSTRDIYIDAGRLVYRDLLERPYGNLVLDSVQNILCGEDSGLLVRIKDLFDISILNCGDNLVIKLKDEKEAK